MSKTNDEAEVAALQLKILQLEEKLVSYERLYQNIGTMIVVLKDAILDAKERIAVIRRGRAAGA